MVKAIPWGEFGIDQTDPGDFGLLDVFDDMTYYPPTSQTEQEELREYYLLVLAAESKALWNKQIAQAQIKTPCGENESIEGVYNWARENKEKFVFNQEKFETEHLDLFEQFTERRADVEATIVDPKRGH